MNLSTYAKIRDSLLHCPSRRDVKEYAARAKCDFSKYSAETLICIYAQEIQRKMKLKAAFHKTEEKKQLYYDMFYKKVEKKERGIMVAMAKEFQITPCMMARLILDIFLNHNDCQNIYFPFVSSVANKMARHKIVAEIFRRPFKLPDLALGRSVQEAVFADDVYGPMAEKAKKAIGHEFEQRLKKWCEEKKIAFQSEEEMRQLGFDKTPDVKLALPIAVDGYIINWIESKAMFGDIECHTEHVKEQLGPYSLRFGPGLVIYWFGFLEALDCQRVKGIGLTDSLPKQVVQINLEQWEKHPEWEFPKPEPWEPVDMKF